MIDEEWAYRPDVQQIVYTLADWTCMPIQASPPRAMLAAAAPDLVRALLAVMKADGNCSCGSCASARDRAEAALRKAGIRK